MLHAHFRNTLSESMLTHSHSFFDLFVAMCNHMVDLESLRPETSIKLRLRLG